MSLKDRRHFRIKYPEGSAAKMMVNNYGFKILDISESGLKFNCDTETPAIDAHFSIEIAFGCGAKHKCKCRVVRVVGQAVMLSFDTPVPKKLLEQEAQLLINQFGKVETTKF